MKGPRPFFILEKVLSFNLVGVLIQISKEYGFLYKEKVYQNLLRNRLREKNIHFTEFPRIPLYDTTTGDQIGNYYPDFLIENKIILEIKAQTQLNDSHINQLIRYLHSSTYEVGLIVNFGTPKAQIIRRVYSNERKFFLNKRRK